MNDSNSLHLTSLTKPLILFDGFCYLCDGFVQFILKHDSQKRFLFTSLQSKTADDIFNQLQIPSNCKNSVVLVQGESFFTESTAVLIIASQLDWPWRVLTYLKIIPRFIRDPLYRFIAKNRYRWFGKRERCMIPKERNRFFD